MNFFDNLKETKSISNEMDNERELKSNDYVDEAIDLMYDFKERDERHLLVRASELFFEAIKYKRTNPSPYVWLAYIFYLLDKYEKAIKYIKLATMYKSTDPMLSDLKKELNMEQPVIKPVKPAYNQPGGFMKQLKLLRSTF